MSGEGISNLNPRQFVLKVRGMRAEVRAERREREEAEQKAAEERARQEVEQCSAPVAPYTPPASNPAPSTPGYTSPSRAVSIIM